MISESLKINSTLTELYLGGDDNIMKIKGKKKEFERKMNREQYWSRRSKDDK